MLKSYSPDMDAIRADIRFFIKEMEKKGVLKVEKTILFVRPFCNDRDEVLDRIS